MKNLSPFKLLEPYVLEDSSYFFGRKKEIIQLGDLLNRSKFVLLYGASGTGKTSLIQCGLRGMYSPRDWYPLFIRRNQDFISTLHLTLDQEYSKWVSTIEEEGLKNVDFKSKTLREKIKILFTWSCRPIFLILDQFEEIFTLSKERDKEVKDFFDALIELDLFNEDLFCKIVIICREEYLAHFYNSEKKVPFVFEHRFRLEKMRNEQMLECIRGLIGADYTNKGYLNMQLGEGADQIILDKLKSKRGEIELTELQIYLDRLYRKDLSRKQKDGAKRDYVLLDEALVDKEELSDVLSDFLDEQLAKINTATRIKNTNYSLTLAILFKFVSSEGTKTNLSFKELLKAFSTSTQTFSTPKIQKCLSQLLAPEVKLLNRLNFVTTEEERYEIMHDRMAECIAKRFSEKEAKYREANAALESRFKRFQEFQLGSGPEKLPEFLSKGDLILIDEAVNVKNISAEKQDFVQRSKKFHAAEERKKARRRTILMGTAVLVSFVLFLAAFNTYEVYKNNQIRQFVIRAKFKEKENPIQANAILDSALALDPQADLVWQSRKDLWFNQQFYDQRKKYSAEIQSISSFKDQHATFIGTRSVIFQINATGKIVDSIPIHNPVVAMRTDQGAGLYWVNENKEVFYWHVASAKTRPLGSLQHELFGIDFHEGKNLLAAVDAWGQLYLWQDQKLIKDKERVPTFLEEYSGDPRVYPDHTLAFNKEGNRLVSADNAASVIIFDLEKKQVKRFLRMHWQKVLAVDYSPVNDEILTCSRDGQAYVWNMEDRTSSYAPKFSHLNQGRRINLGKFSPNGELIILGYTDRLLEIWNYQKNTTGQYIGHQDRVIGAIWSAKSNAFITAGKDSSLIRWRKASRAQRTFGSYTYSIEGLCYAAEHNELFIAGGTGINESQRQKYLDYAPLYPQTPQNVYRWKIGKKNRLLDSMEIPLLGIKKLINISHGKQLIACGESADLYWWDIDKDSLFHKTVACGTVQDLCQIDAEHFAVLGEEGVEIWNSKGERQQKILPPPGGGLNCLAWNPQNTTFYLGRYNGAEGSGLFERYKGRWKPIEGYPSSVVCIDISTDGQKLAVGTMDNKIYWGSIQNLSKPATIAFSKYSTDPQEEAYDLAFSPDGESLAVATKGGKFILLRLKKGYEQMILGDMDDAGMHRVVFAPNGQSIYCGGGDGWVYQYSIVK